MKKSLLPACLLALSISPSNASTTVSLMTYNVGQPSPVFATVKHFLCAALGVDCANERMQSLIEMISAHKPDIVVLQESGIEFTNALKHALPQHHFLTTDPGSLVIASNVNMQDSQFIPFPSYMRRGMLFTQIILARHRFCLATVHLESLLEETETRKRQLDRLFDTLSPCENTLLAGDFNFAENAPEQSKIPADYHDSWRINKTGKGLTYDLENNPLAKSNALDSEKSRRLDRIYIRSQAVKNISVKIIGNQPPMPSDHYGLIAEFTIHPPR